MELPTSVYEVGYGCPSKRQFSPKVFTATITLHNLKVLVDVVAGARSLVGPQGGRCDYYCETNRTWR